MIKRGNNLINAVIEIDDVEYLIDETTADKIIRKEEIIPLIRLIDNKMRTVSSEDILKIVQEKGITDHL